MRESKADLRDTPRPKLLHENLIHQGRNFFFFFSRLIPGWRNLGITRIYYALLCRFLFSFFFPMNTLPKCSSDNAASVGTIAPKHKILVNCIARLHDVKWIAKPLKISCRMQQESKNKQNCKCSI